VSRRPVAAVFLLGVRGSWRSSLAWGGFFALVAVAVISAYREAYPTQAARRLVALLIEGNRAFEALNGQGTALDTPGGFAAWRVGGPVAVFAGVAGLLATTRLLRGEEEAGRWESLVAGAVSRGRATAATLAAFGTVLVGVWFAIFLGFVAGGLSVSGSALIALTLSLVFAAFGAVGALAAQLVPVRRRAAGLAGTVLALALLLRVLADGTASLGSLRPFTPLGWAEMVHPFVNARPLWLVPLVVWTAVLSVAAVALAARRDLGAGWIGGDEARRSSTRLLGSTTGYAARSSIRPALVWIVAVGTFSAVLGALAADIVSFLEASPSIRRFTAGLGAVGFAGETGFLGIVFTFLAVPVSLVAVFRLTVAREEESSGRLDLVLAGAVRRPTWLLGWAAVALGSSAVVALVAGSAAWATTVSSGGRLSFGQAIAGAMNVLPVAVVFCGLAVLLLAVVPRWSTALALGAVGVGEVLSILAAQNAVPGWLGDLSPFSHLRPVPAVGADLGAALGMLAVGVGLAGLGAAVFSRRDVKGA
jgi:ABC-2 type transport system permease protein